MSKKLHLKILITQFHIYCAVAVVIGGYRDLLREVLVEQSYNSRQEGSAVGSFYR